MTLRPTLARDAFLAPFVAAGYRAVEPAILQPADIFLDLSGEELGKRLYLTTDVEGRDLCLRPELTIPVCLDHVAGGDPARAASYCYFGPAFRHRPGASGEFVQAGIESIGRADTATCDAEVFALALDCVRRYGLDRPHIRIGDTGLFRAVIEALELPAAWRRKLARDFGRADLVAADIASLEAVRGSPASSYSGILAALGGADRKAARALVEDLLAIGGHMTVGGRTVGEIADRFLEQADLKDGARVPAERLQLLQTFLAARMDAQAAPAALSGLLKTLGTSAEAALAIFAARNTALAKAGVDLTRITFDPAFGRRLDYYSGFVFEMHDASKPDQLQVVGGGRYDGMLHFLGAPAPVPAVGFSVWVERLPGAQP